MNIPREPVRLIGVIVTLILAVVTTLAGESIISDVVAGRITDIVNAAAKFLALIAPLLAAELARPQVTPVAAPQLPVGTPVTVTSRDTGAAIGSTTISRE